MNNHVSSVEKLNQPIKTSAIIIKQIFFLGGGVHNTHMDTDTDHLTPAALCAE